jgi:hypothetical protein
VVRQLQQCQGVAASLGDDLIADPVIERFTDRGGQQRPRIGVAEAAHVELGQPGQRTGDRACVAHAEQQRHPLGGHPPRDEGQDLGRRLVQPLRIVDEAEQRFSFGDFRHQGEGRQPHQEAFRGRAGTQPERHAQRSLLGFGQLVETTQQRAAQLVQTGERELRLGFHTHRGLHPEPRQTGGTAGLVEQGRLADARLPAHHQRPAAPGSRLRQQQPDRLTLRAPAHEAVHRRSPPPPHGTR